MSGPHPRTHRFEDSKMWALMSPTARALYRQLPPIDRIALELVLLQGILTATESMPTDPVIEAAKVGFGAVTEAAMGAFGMSKGQIEDRMMAVCGMIRDSGATEGADVSPN